MEQTIKAANSQPPFEVQAHPIDDGQADGVKVPLMAVGLLDARSLFVGLAGGVGFFVLATLCLSLSRFDSTLASVWLPNAAAVTMLLLTRIRNEVVAYLAFAVACVSANILADNPVVLAIDFTVANLLEVMLVTWLIRRFCGQLPDLTNLNQLGRFLQYAGFVGPLASTLVAAPALGDNLNSVIAGATAWFLSASMGMLLVVPPVLLVVSAWRERPSPARPNILDAATFLFAGSLGLVLVFLQNFYPLLFLVPPLTLMLAFRLGALGPALFVPGIAVATISLTYLGLGPIAQSTASQIAQTYLVQAFIAVNFTTGLPVAAILAGRARLTREIAKGQSEIALLTANIADAVLKLDNNGICTYVSPSVETVLGRPADDIIGKRVTERTHEDAYDRIAQVLDRMLNGISLKERITYRRLLDSEEGMPVFIEADCTLVIDPETGERDGIVVSARDVTDRVELELLLTRARASAENAARAKSEFLANMSHEIRTPMNGVLGFAELMQQGELDADNRRYTEMIVQSGRSMMMLLNDILDLSKIEAGEISINSEPVDLFATIAECAALHRPTAESKGLELNFVAGHGDDDEEARGPVDDPFDDPFQRPWVQTDGLRLRQIMLNLVGNAVKFTEAGKVDISYWAGSSSIVIEVSDTGIGISPNRLNTIFAPFTQAEGDTARRFGGTGLGLTISRQLAELLGGTIEVSSAPGEGSTFRLTLPAAYATPARTSIPESEIVEPADLPQSARILLVEDHDVNRMLATEMLERCGQQVAIAHDGNEAIAMVIDAAMRDRLYDLVLMDIQMPGCDGFAATRAIRAEGIGPDVMPIVALTANAFPDDIAAARAAGMQAHLAKPLVFANLARVLQRWLPTRIVDNEDERSDGDVTVAEPPIPGPAPNSAMALLPPPTADEDKPSIPSQSHSPALLGRWNERRSEAVEAVRDALERGDLGAEQQSDETFAKLARLVHKLAGTAAIFGEAELGDKASVFERALREPFASELVESLAYDLLCVADDPADGFGQTGT